MPAVETSATVQSRSGFASGVNGMMPGSCRAAHAFITWRLAKSRKRYESMPMVRLAIIERSQSRPFNHANRLCRCAERNRERESCPDEREAEVFRQLERPDGVHRLVVRHRR